MCNGLWISMKIGMVNSSHLCIDQVTLQIHLESLKSLSEAWAAIIQENIKFFEFLPNFPSVSLTWWVHSLYKSMNDDSLKLMRCSYIKRTNKIPFHFCQAMDFFKDLVQFDCRLHLRWLNLIIWTCYQSHNPKPWIT